VVYIHWERNDCRYANQAPPYCLGSTNTAGGYSFPSAETYIHEPNGISQPQAQCLYLDAYDAVSDPLEESSVFVPTRMTITKQLLSPQPNCSLDQHSYCTWGNVYTNLTYLADVDMFTLNVDHSFSSTTGISKSAVQMQGYLLNQQDEKMNACTGYDAFAAGCPSFIRVGVKGSTDILSLKTILLAGGLNNLDQIASPTFAALSTQTYRYAGLVVVLNIMYSNYMLGASSTDLGTGILNDDTVFYYYKVSIIPDQEYKAVFSVTPGEQVRTCRMHPPIYAKYPLDCHYFFADSQHNPHYL
jgi:hypothetical protein